MIIEYIAVFGSGVLVSLTPCVYPLIPVTASIVGSLNVKGTKSGGFVISLIYVLGISVSYSLFAITASLMGRAFGSLQSHPAVYLLIAVFLICGGLVMLEVLPFPVALFGGDLRSKIKPRNTLMVFVLGILSGLAVGPCTTPILGSLLLYVAAKKNLLYNISLVFVFSLGVGASLILVGTFSGLLSRLPRSGPWLKRVDQICASVLFAAGGYFILRAMGVVF